MKGAGTLVVSLRGVNFGFWSHLGCSGQNAIIFIRKGHAKKYKNIYLICIFSFHFIYSIPIIQVFSFVCVLTWSILGVKKAWATHRSVSFRCLIQNSRRASPPLSYAGSPPGTVGTDRHHQYFLCFFLHWKRIFFSRFYTSQILFTLQKQQINRKKKIRIKRISSFINVLFFRKNLSQSSLMSKAVSCNLNRFANSNELTLARTTTSEELTQ